MPPRLSFRHLYFSPDRRGAHAREDAAKALAKLAGQPEDAKAAALADPFMFQDYYRDRAPDYLGKEFGPQFALAVDPLAPGSWHGPVESGFGWHLVFVDTVIPGRVPAFEEIEPEVKTAWLAEQKALAWEKAYREMRAKLHGAVARGAAGGHEYGVALRQREGCRFHVAGRRDAMIRRRNFRQIVAGLLLAMLSCSHRRARTRCVRPTSRSKKPCPASLAYCGARRSSQACVCPWP